MSAAAERLRQALADAPDGLHVGRDDFRDLSLFADDRELTAWCGGDHLATMRLIGLLLAAAPHLADLLASPLPLDRQITARRAAADAIIEAVQAMEAES